MCSPSSKKGHRNMLQTPKNFVALWSAFIGWTLTAVALGLIQWRVWLVPSSDVITSGVVWVGLWRTCFHSHTEVTDGWAIMKCNSIRLTEAFTPPEVAAGQVLMLLSLLVGLCGNAGGVYAMRNAYFGAKEYSCVRLGFVVTGAFCLLAATTSLIPLLWNLSSVVANQTIYFPPEFRLPQAPESQHRWKSTIAGESVAAVGEPSTPKGFDQNQLGQVMYLRKVIWQFHSRM
uniref:Claudin 34 n=1 Tax=Oryzias latipes TaxID=8090 RepID=A0A3P9HQ02_ORYLA